MRIILVSNTSKSKVEKTDGKYKITGIPITVDNAKMNRIKYSADENVKGMPTMVGKPIALTHPEDKDGRNVSIFSPDGIDFYSGGKVSQTYNKDGIWYANADIDEKRLRSTDNGEYFANRLDLGLPIGVSTGLTFEANNESGDGYDMIAKNMEFDHLAMLHESERPAGGDATVMRFNGEDVEAVNVDLLINSVTDEHSEKELSLFAKFTQWLANHGSFEPDEKTGYNAQDLNTNEGSIMNREEMLEALGLAVNSQVTDEELKTLMKSKLSVNASEGFSKEELAEAINAAVKPLTEKLEAINAEKLQGKRDAVNKLDLGLPVTAINAMTDVELDGLLAKHGQQFVAGEPGAVHGRNSVQSDELTFATPSFMGDK